MATIPFRIWIGYFFFFFFTFVCYTSASRFLDGSLLFFSLFVCLFDDQPHRNDSFWVRNTGSLKKSLTLFGLKFIQFIFMILINFFFPFFRYLLLYVYTHYVVEILIIIIFFFFSFIKYGVSFCCLLYTHSLSLSDGDLRINFCEQHEW